jgi:predicted anti-sigma-YlaC factor YlaD
MSEHVFRWLGAYHDGELRGRRLAQVEAHLAECTVCRAELEGLQALSGLLQSVPGPAYSLPPERFVAQVGLRLPRRPAQPAWQRLLERGWQMVPLGLLGTWAVAQAVFIVAGAALLAWRTGLGERLTAGWLPAWQPGLAEGLSLSGANLGEVEALARQLFSQGGLVGWVIVLYLAFLFLTGVLYWSWLASWWAYRQHRQSHVEQNGK